MKRRVLSYQGVVIKPDRYGAQRKLLATILFRVRWLLSFETLADFVLHSFRIGRCLSYVEEEMLPPREQLVVMHCDLVEFSRLTSQNEDATFFAVKKGFEQAALLVSDIEAPSYTVEDTRNSQPYEHSADVEPFVEGLLKAGFPSHLQVHL